MSRQNSLKGIIFYRLNLSLYSYMIYEIWKKINKFQKKYKIKFIGNICFIQVSFSFSFDSFLIVFFLMWVSCNTRTAFSMQEEYFPYSTHQVYKKKSHFMQRHLLFHKYIWYFSRSKMTKQIFFKYYFVLQEMVCQG